jgi:hypothetical protein
MPNSAIARALVSERPRRLVLHEIPLPDVCDDDAAKDAGAEFVMMTGLGDRDAEDLLATMAGERDDVPPVHRVVTP